MIRTLTTKSEFTFIYDDTSSQNLNGIIRANFISLRCVKMYHKKLNEKGQLPYSYEYPSLVFQNKNMCRTTDIGEDNEASETEKEIFNRVRSKSKLGKELNKYIRDNYLYTMNEQDVIEIESPEN